jgi:hypothetical protein
VLLFGGNGYTRTGQGELVESEQHRFHEVELVLTKRRNLPRYSRGKDPGRQ